MSTQVVLITGALTGIGRATAIAFARAGARVVVSGRRDEAGQALAAELRDLGTEADYIRADVRHDDDVRALVEQTADSYAATFETNVLGTVLSLKHELRVMQAQGGGSIINLSSTMGHKAAPGASLYTASKHAVEGLTKAAALEGAAFGVRVNGVAPGPVDTDMLTRFTGSDDRKAGLIAGVPLKRAGRPEEIARAVLFLASDQASFLTGQIVSVDGGKSAQ